MSEKVNPDKNRRFLIGRAAAGAAAVAALAATGALAQPINGGTSTTIATYSAAGTTQGTATAIISTVNIITTVAAGTGVILTGNGSQTVLNQGANTLLVYPSSGGQIFVNGTGLGSNAAFSIASGGSVQFNCAASAQCYAQFSSFQ